MARSLLWGLSPDPLINLNSNGMARRRSQPVVVGQERGIKCFRECDVGGIVGRDVVSEPPHARKEYGMGITHNPKIQQILNRLLRSTGRQASLANRAPERVQHLDIEQKRSVKRVRLRADPVLNALSCRRLQQPLHNG